MARSRVIHPGILTSDHVKEVGYLGAYFWIGLILNADDDGRLRGDVGVLKATIYPHHMRHLGASKLHSWIIKLRDRGMIEPYTVGGQQYIQICNWNKWQRISHPTPSRIPPPNSGNIPETFRSRSGNIPDEEERRGGERREKDLKAPSALAESFDLVVDSKGSRSKPVAVAPNETKPSDPRPWRKHLPEGK